MSFFYLFIQAYDQHLNMILGDVEEVVTTVEIDDETYEEIVRVSSLTIVLLILDKYFVMSGLLDVKLSLFL